MAPYESCHTDACPKEIGLPRWTSRTSGRGRTGPCTTPGTVVDPAAAPPFGKEARRGLRTGEVRRVRVVDYEVKGKINERLRLAVGR